MSKITIYQMEQSNLEFKKTHTVNIGGLPKEGKPPKWFIEFVNKQEEHWAIQESFNKKQLEFNQFVIDQFKKHGWVK